MSPDSGDRPAARAAGSERHAGTAVEVFLVFLRLGLTSFGGPIAHLGYYREAFVVRRRWLTEAEFADLVALCQFLPGPASSQVGFAVGLWRAGAMGAAAAWTAFTLPSAIAMAAVAFWAAHAGAGAAEPLFHGLKLVAVAVVAQAVWGMARSLCPDPTRAAIGLTGLVVVALFGGTVGQLGAIGLGAVLGLILCRGAGEAATAHPRPLVGRAVGAVSLFLFFLLLGGLPFLAAVGGHAAALFDAFYRAGALVFGGGHVVLPLLQAEVVQPGWVSRDDFLAGYGAAQAVPGPLFTFAAYLGAVAGPEPNGVVGAAVGLVAIFLPGFLLLVGVLPFWEALRARPLARAAMQGTNAAVVGILAAALYDPVWTSAVLDRVDFALAAALFLLLTAWKLPSWVIVILGAFGGIAVSFL